MAAAIYGGFHSHGGTTGYLERAGLEWKIPSFEMDDDLGVARHDELETRKPPYGCVSV